MPTGSSHTAWTYSVVIPHKDTPVLLQRCVDSIPDRMDIQIIVVDDRSDIPDPEWVRFREKNPRVELCLTQKGGGAGYARNIGLGKASGRWIIFADADDFFYDGAFDILDREAGKGHDVLYFLCDSRDGTTNERIDDRVPSIRENIRKGNLDGLRYTSSVPWGKMIRKELIDRENLRFDEVEVANDVMFSLRLGAAARNPGTIPSAPLYCCTRNAGSLYHEKSVRRIMTRIKVAKRANDFLHDRGLDGYRIPILWVGYFLPWHPFLFLWGIWKFRYKGDSRGYLKELFLLFLGKLHLR